MGQLKVEEQGDLSTEGGAVELILEFSEGNPKHIMGKIKGLQDDRIVRLDPRFFESDDDDDDESLT